MVSADWENVCRRSQSWCATVHAVPPDHTVPCRSSSLDVRCRARIRSPRTSSRARTRSRAASCATVGTTTGVISSRRSNRARCWASLASVLTGRRTAAAASTAPLPRTGCCGRSETGPARSRSVRPRTPPRPGRAAPAASPAPPRAADPAAPGTSRLCWHRYRRPPPTLRARPDRRSYALAAPGPPATVGTTDQVHPRRQPTTTCERGPGPRVRAPPYRLTRHIEQLPATAWQVVRLDRDGAYRRPRVADAPAALSAYPGTVRQLVVTGLGRDAPTVLITNDRATSAKQLIERYARRMNIEQRLPESIRSFHGDALSGAVPLNVDLDVALSVLAGAVCASLRRRLTGYHHATPDTLQRRFLSTTGTIENHHDTI